LLDTLITSKTRIKLLVRFFLNPESRSYLRSLAAEFGESTNAIRLELNRFEGANLLRSDLEGNRKIYQANQSHPLFSTVHDMVRHHLGIDALVEHVSNKLGSLDTVYLTGEMAKGSNASIIDLVITGEDINKEYLMRLIDKAEKIIGRKVRYALYSKPEFEDAKEQLEKQNLLLLWRG
jgi:hypothetical protein